MPEWKVQEIGKGTFSVGSEGDRKEEEGAESV